MSTAIPAVVQKLYGHLHGSGLKAQLLRGSIGSIAVKIANTFLAFFMVVLLARTLGPENYGIYSFAFAIATLIAIPSQLGLPQLVIRETAKIQATEQWGLLRGLWRWSSVLILSFSTLIALTAMCGIWLYGRSINDSQQLTLLISLFLVPLIALGNLRGAALKGLRHALLGQLPESVLRPMFFILLIAIASVMTNSITPAEAMGWYVLSVGLAFAIGGILLWRVKPHALEDNPTPQYRSRQWLASALPLVMISGLQIVNNQADIIMLGVFRPQEEVGVYRVVVSSAGLVIFGLQAINIVVAPYLARLYFNGDMDKLQSLITLCSRAVFSLALPVFLAVLVFGSWFLSTAFGDEYSTGYYGLIILSLGQLFNAAFGPVATILNMTGWERSSAKAVVISAMVNVFLNWFLVPLYGVEGAATSTALTLFLWNAIMWKQAKAKTGLNSAVSIK